MSGAPDDYEPTMEEVIAAIRAIIGEWEDEPEDDVDARCERAIDEMRGAVSALQTGNVIYADFTRRGGRNGRR